MCPGPGGLKTAPDTSKHASEDLTKQVETAAKEARYTAAITLAGMLANGKPAKGARAYLFIGPSTRISPMISAPGERPHARSEITIGPITTFAREAPEEVVRAPCVERGSPKVPD